MSGPPRIVVLDGARTLGAKILVSGGGRCNVTHEVVTERDFNGSTPAAIRKVLRRFPVEETVTFFRALGVPLKREGTGKLFPVSDRARDVLDALLRECRRLGVDIQHPWRVGSLDRVEHGFQLNREGAHDTVFAHRLVLATGGKSLPRSGSDGGGYRLVECCGHRIVPPLPALVPLTLTPHAAPLLALSGISARVDLQVCSGTGRRLWQDAGELLLTHFGISGPVVLDASRHLVSQRQSDRGAGLVVNWIPSRTREEVDRELQRLGTVSVVAWLRKAMPERLARALCELGGVSAAATGATLPREERARLVATLAGLRLEVSGDRGFTHAEVTAGGVPLSELHLDTLESRCQAGLYLVGEICDVDGRIGGFNFQWAWASGFVAGTALGGADDSRVSPHGTVMS